jgi:hypothetical protein
MVDKEDVDIMLYFYFFVLFISAIILPIYGYKISHNKLKSFKKEKIAIFSVFLIVNVILTAYYIYKYKTDIFTKLYDVICGMIDFILDPKLFHINLIYIIFCIISIGVIVTLFYTNKGDSKKEVLFSTQFVTAMFLFVIVSGAYNYYLNSVFTNETSGLDRITEALKNKYIIGLFGFLLFVIVFFYHDKQSNGLQSKMRNHQIPTIIFTLVMCALYLFYTKIYDPANIVTAAIYALIALIFVYIFTYNPYNITPKLSSVNLFTVAFVILFFITMIMWYSNSTSAPTTLNETFKTFLMGSFSLIVSVGVIMLLLSSFGTFSKNKPSTGTYILNIMIIIGMLTIVYNLMDKSGVLKNNPVLKLLMNIILYIPCLLSNILEYVMREYYQTKYSSLILILIEIVLLIIYYFYPYIVSWLYTGDGILLINKPLSLNKEKILGYYETLSGNDQIALEKIKNPYKILEGDTVEVRQTDNSTPVPGKILNIRDTDGKYDVVYDDGRTEYNVLRKNIYTGKDIPLTIGTAIQAKQNWLLATITNINNDDTYSIAYNYQNISNNPNGISDDNIDQSMVRIVNYINPNINAYGFSISFWLFINSTNENSNKYTSLLNYSNNPNIMYNASTNDFIVAVAENEQVVSQIDFDSKNINTDPELFKTIYSNQNIALQKWNNFVINYDSGTIDIFYNGELVSSTSQVVPNLVHHALKVGSPKGISAGICNVVYYRHPLDIITINNLYNLSKSTGVPNVPEMSLFSYNL